MLVAGATAPDANLKKNAKKQIRKANTFRDAPTPRISKKAALDQPQRLRADCRLWVWAKMNARMT